MSATLDLNGGTHTIAADTTETYYQITDSSSGHDGTLVIEAGAVLQFDDIDGAGFAAEATAITVTVTGTAAAPVTIKSIDTFPHHPWATPAESATLNVSECLIKAFEGAVESGTWTFNNVTWGESNYCSVEDVRAITRASATGLMAVSDSEIERFIADAVEEIEAKAGRKWSENTATEEIIEWNGEDVIKVRNYPIISVTSLYYRSGDSAWTLMTAGSEADYYLSEQDKELGGIELLEPPSYEIEAFKITYKYGAEAVPSHIRKLAAMMAAIPTYYAMRGGGHKDVYAGQIAQLETKVQRLLEDVGSNMTVYVSPTPRHRRGIGRY